MTFAFLTMVTTSPPRSSHQSDSAACILRSLTASRAFTSFTLILIQATAAAMSGQITSLGKSPTGGFDTGDVRCHGLKRPLNSELCLRFTDSRSDDSPGIVRSQSLIVRSHSLCRPSASFRFIIAINSLKLVGVFGSLPESGLGNRTKRVSLIHRRGQAAQPCTQEECRDFAPFALEEAHSRHESARRRKPRIWAFSRPGD